MNFAFRTRLLNNYKFDSTWYKINIMLFSTKSNIESSVFLFFYRDRNELIFRSNVSTISDLKSDYNFQSQRLYVSRSIIDEILAIIYDDNKRMSFNRCYKQIASSYCIKKLSKVLYKYLRHCSQCQLYQTRRHKFYNLL